MNIGITGVKGAGKDTAAAFFVDHHSFRRMGYADALKEAMSALFDTPQSWFEKHKSNPDARVQVIRRYDAEGYKDAVEYASEMTLRTFLQRFGTEMGREVFGPDFWVLQFTQRMESNVNYVIPDVRFNNEAVNCNYIIEVVRDGFTNDPHASEQGIREELIDFIVVNNGTIEELHKRLDAIMQEIMSSWQTTSR